ncbi:tRNA(Ile)(2)-agmatinylcytidine synthase [Methanimicrococcus blatticola]|uniref:tRNA(Ile2) 2-agmatinylcytidine synthetase TiaS n=1 Tax=Methanimicrococcus blatticola TaxID=91560 RepID=A0A484F4C0_9EURY|nr:tRNA(Ile)(2)-agmatinylcytidine synthase [Methanimicrococcus blatticola]MBZ3935526.1 tRNA(Ile)(2)-agmatinylcytidine synthase [Methanimicrococcus blatticola]MCC2509169.1 tRNA(Ile)(2)-agmatinylcytidine synthase [Methanimicrococcus blatticola]TDQ69466.1 tRNA(Ile2) 2-agmatinylcytidine synthetase [Methanimicrococcus blatticola]
MLIGIDDTDSNEGMCTTYLAALLAEELKAFGVVNGFPYLVRLNPTIPYKTRGNAALGIHFSMFDENPETKRDLISFVTEKINEYSDLSCEKTNPGAVFIFDGACESESLRLLLYDFFKKAVTDVIEIEEAAAILNQFESEFPDSVFHFSLKNGRGLIGALAVCGAMLNPGWESTYEYLAYRLPKNWGSNGGPERFVDPESLISVDQKTTPETWDTIDYDKKTKPFPVCVPGGNDPVLFGIRGNSANAVKTAAEFVVSEEVERFQIFQTNQGTDAHLISINPTNPINSINSIHSVSEMQPLHSYILEGTVDSKAETIEGGHDIFKLKDSNGTLLECAAYEPTGNFRHIIRELIPGDEIRVYGSFKNETLNLEKIKILELADDFKLDNPICFNCGKRMESAGIGQGFRCKKCKTKADSKIEIHIPRKIRPRYYEVPPSARRHLSKPLIRYSKEDLEK